jgi:hypothetical protein
MDLFVIHEEDFLELFAGIEDAIGGVSSAPVAERHARVADVEGDIGEAEQIVNRPFLFFSPLFSPRSGRLLAVFL